MFFKRTKMIEAIHDFLREHGFTQVETPMLQTLAGGAASRPFVTHHNALDIDVYLRISVELYLNRCIVGGLENIYDLGRAFRNEGISHRHSPEFTILEWMMSYADYWDVAKFTEELAESVALRTLGTTKVEQYDGRVVDLATPVAADHAARGDRGRRRDRLPGGLARAAGRGARRAPSGARDETWAKLVDAIYVKHVEPTLHPAHARLRLPRRPLPDLQAPLRGSAALAEHFDSVIRGMEILSGDTELNDPLDQLDRFVIQRQQAPADDDGDQPQPNDEEYVRALEYGMAPTAGGGLGVDRLLMVLTGVESMREVVPFPTLRERR